MRFLNQLQGVWKLIETLFQVIGIAPQTMLKHFNFISLTVLGVDLSELLNNVSSFFYSLLY